MRTGGLSGPTRRALLAGAGAAIGAPLVACGGSPEAASGGRPAALKEPATVEYHHR